MTDISDAEFNAWRARAREVHQARCLFAMTGQADLGEALDALERHALAHVGELGDWIEAEAERLANEVIRIYRAAQPINSIT